MKRVRLERKAPLLSAAPALKRKALPKMSAKAIGELREWRQAKLVVRRRSGGDCEARTMVCTGRSEHVHHRLPKGRGGKSDPALLLDVCGDCHRQIHAFPRWSAERGFLLRRAS